ncbi:MAG: ester cyclase [Actinomycetia bacterium]|nr:ester cyclase [Actinomycetes bacterium]
MSAPIGTDELPPVLRRLVDAMLSNDPDTISAMYTPDCRLADAYTVTKGRAAFHEAVSYFFNAFKMLEVEVQNVISHGAELVVNWRWTAVHQGEYLGVPANGARFASWNLMWLEIKDGMVDSDLSVWDASELQKLQRLAAGSTGPSGAPATE